MACSRRFFEYPREMQRILESKEQSVNLYATKMAERSFITHSREFSKDTYKRAAEPKELFIVSGQGYIFSTSFRFAWNLVVTQAVNIGKKIIPAAARTTARVCPSLVTPKILEPTVVTFMSDQLKAFQ